MFEVRELTTPVHFSPIKIHGTEGLHLMAIMKTETTMTIVETAAMPLAISAWFLSGESRRNRKATEHFVSQSVMMYRISLP